MAIDLKKIAKRVDLDLTGVPEKDIKKVKKEVGDFIIDEILRSVSKGSSPVKNGKYKKGLSKEYSALTGKKIANMELEGDMLDSLKSKNIKTTNAIEVGIFKNSEVPKADGHNNFSGKSKLPRRQFIPKKNQKFNERIEKGVNSIINEFKKEPPTSFTPSQGVESEAFTSVVVGDLFTDDFLDDFLRSEGLI